MVTCCPPESLPAPQDAAPEGGDDAAAGVQTARPGRSARRAAPDAEHLRALWDIVAEGDLFTSSHERRYLGFQLFTILLPHLT